MDFYCLFNLLVPEVLTHPQIQDSFIRLDGMFKRIIFGYTLFHFRNGGVGKNRDISHEVGSLE